MDKFKIYENLYRIELDNKKEVYVIAYDFNDAAKKAENFYLAVSAKKVTLILKNHQMKEVL